MTKTFLTLSLIISILLHFSPGFSGNTKEKFLRVKGETILDASDKPILFRGFNVQFKHFKNELGEPGIKRIADLGGNSIRLVMDYRDFVVTPFKYNEALPRGARGELAFAMLGWGSFSGDLALRSLVATADAKKGFGAFNWSGYSNPKVDELLERAFATVDEKARETLAREAMRTAMRDVAVIPLHHQVTTWAMRKPLAYAPRTDEFTFAHDVRPQ